MTRKEKEILYEILKIMIHRHELTMKIIKEQQKQIKLLNTKINLLRGGKNVRN